MKNYEKLQKTTKTTQTIKNHQDLMPNLPTTAKTWWKSKEIVRIRPRSRPRKQSQRLLPTVAGENGYLAFWFSPGVNG
jgi:hypothetical protein